MMHIAEGLAQSVAAQITLEIDLTAPSYDQAVNSWNRQCLTTFLGLKQRIIVLV